MGVERPTAGGASRRRFLRAAGFGAAGAAAVAISACGDSPGDKAKPTQSGSQLGEGDVGIVNFALTLEYLEADLYSQVADAKLFSGKRADLLKRIGEHEREHVSALEAAVKKLGGKPAARPSTTFPLERGADHVLRVAAELENTGAAAYLGQLRNILDRDLLATALAIHAVEGRHAGVLNRLIGDPFSAGAFATPRSMDEVLSDIGPFIA
jgi:rubrerythrin